MISYLLLKYNVDPVLFVTLTNSIYNGLVVLAVAVGLFLVYRKISSLGYEAARVRRFFLIIAFIILPAGYVSSRAANIFYHPSEFWSFSLFSDIVSSQSYHTFHASLVLPTVLISALLFVMRFRFWDVSDAFFLYIPLSNAIGRVACFLVGCCWGGPIGFSVFGFDFDFYNPVPLYDIAYNLGIFLVLRKMHGRLYAPGSQVRSVEGGKVTALYLILYGDARFLIEFIRTESVAAWGLTQAQIVMIVFVAIGSVILAGLALRNRYAEIPESDRPLYGTRLAAGGLIVYFALFFIVIALLMRAGLVTWPLFPVEGVMDAWKRIPSYLPVFFLETAGLLFMAGIGMPFSSAFRIDYRKLMNPWFLFGLIGSLAYTVILLGSTNYSLRGAEFWPPVIVISLLNAFAEEVFFRLAFYRLLRGSGLGVVQAVAAQSALYSTIHLAVGGPVFFALSFVYGMVLGLVFEKTGSVIPCIICHFIIDIGVIGLPMMMY
ncbi:MAG: prolipoprotein diacylglyceryl transferase [Spirochaetes bacterium]|jgi:phosphatidylglycerol:prolipoprotein diacylglycerol transferase|nr:prolipoprotein diacylglyceryl transferase [Spirochaetota bacterium]